MKKFLSRKEIDEALENNEIDSKPYMTLNDELTADEMRCFRHAIKVYARKNHIHIDDITHTDIYHIAKELNWNKFIFHDE